MAHFDADEGIVLSVEEKRLLLEIQNEMKKPKQQRGKRILELIEAIYGEIK